MKKNSKIIVLGPTYVDHEIYIKGNISLDGSCEIESERLYPGGTGLSYALALAHLGNFVQFHSVLGNDENSKIVTRTLQKEKRIEAKLQKTNSKTDYAMLLIDKGSHKVAASQKIISNTLDIEALDGHQLETADAIVITSFKNNLVADILSFLENIRRPFVMWAPHRQNCEEVKKVISHFGTIDHISLSTEEYEVMQQTTNPLIHGVNSITVTHGRQGCSLITENSRQIFESHKSLMNPKDTNGAGEAFGAAFLTAYLATKNMGLAVEAGQYNAYKHIQTEGPNFPRIELDTLIRIAESKIKLTVRPEYNYYNEL